VFLERLVGSKPRQVRLVAMDHSCCFTCNSELSERKLRRIGWIQDAGVYGLFPAFKPFIHQTFAKRAVAQLQSVEVGSIQAAVDSIPDEWDVSKEIRNALVESLVRRAKYVAATMEEKLHRQCWPEQLFDVNDPPEHEQ
jgi:hypothetical protein